MSRSSLKVSLIIAAAIGMAGCASDMPADNDHQVSMPANSATNGSGEWNTPKGLDAGGVKSGGSGSIPSESVPGKL
jgi:hypothetical protein